MKKIVFLSFVLWAEVASGQVTYPPVTIAFPQLLPGGDPSGPHYMTLLQIVNNNSASTTAQVQININGAITAGWMEIVYSPCDALTTVLLDSFSATTLISEIGIDPASDVLPATDFAAETDGVLNTGIAIANPDTAAAYVLARLWDPNTGNVLASNALSVPANGHVARFLTELFASVSNIKQIRAKVSLDSCSSSACNLEIGRAHV